MDDVIDDTKVDVTEVTKPVVTERIVKEPKIRDSNEYVLELRKENERLRKTMEDMSNAKAEELSNKKLEDLRASTEEAANRNAEKLFEKHRTAMEEASKARLIKSELKNAATRAGVIDFDDLYEIAKKNLKPEFDDDGEMTNASDIISEIKSRKAHLFAGVNTSSTASAPRDRPTAPVNTVNDMPQDDFNELLSKMGVQVKSRNARLS